MATEPIKSKTGRDRVNQVRSGLQRSRLAGLAGLADAREEFFEVLYGHRFGEQIALAMFAVGRFQQRAYTTS